jgi:coenzyme F420-reducing hydrogenase delta subunit/Pyruvate/2-oxoacid:ferredoxin oxidoreductase delta subunit
MSIARPVDFILTHGPELLAAGLDPAGFSLLVAGFPHTRVLLLDPALAPDQQEERLTSFFYRPERDPVVLAAMDPQQRAAGTIQLLLEKFKLNPELLSLVDLQAALENPDPKTRTLKALDLLRLAAVQVSRAISVGSQEMAVSRQVLVWGDSYAGLKAAADLADLGYPVILATPPSTLAPLAPGGPRPLTPADPLASLLQKVKGHPSISLRTDAQIQDFRGTAGNFCFRLDTPQGREEVRVGAVILAPEINLAPNPERYGLPCHPRILSQTQLEHLLISPPETLNFLSGGNHPAAVALLVGLAGEGHPSALRRALTAAGLLAPLDCQIHLLVGDTKVAEPGLEQALRAAQDAGLILYKLGQRPEFRLAADRPVLSFFEPVMGWSMELTVDLLGFDEEYQAAPGNPALAEELRLPLAPGGFLQSDNVHHLPVATSRRGIYVVGPGRAVMDLEAAFSDADAAVLESQRLLGPGKATAPLGRAVVDRGRCVLCLTCYRLCPHAAITFDNRACIHELACQGCGVCASECPNEAIQIFNCSDEQIQAQLWALDPQLAPRLVAFMCGNSAWEAYQAALKLKHASLPLGFTALRMPCAGKIDIDYLLRAFTQRGIGGVLVLGCHPENCKSQRGNELARGRVEQAQGLLEEAGINPRRLRYATLAANSPQSLIETVDELWAQLELNSESS